MLIRDMLRVMESGSSIEAAVVAGFLAGSVANGVITVVAMSFPHAVSIVVWASDRIAKVGQTLPGATG